MAEIDHPIENDFDMDGSHVLKTQPGGVLPSSQRTF